MHELVAFNNDCDVRRARFRCGEEDEIAWCEVVLTDGVSVTELFANVTRERDAVQCEHILGEPAAIEPGRIAAAIPVRRPSQRQGCSDELLEFNNGWGGIRVRIA